jgi:hypothetical protein
MEHRQKVNFERPSSTPLFPKFPDPRLTLSRSPSSVTVGNKYSLVPVQKLRQVVRTSCTRYVNEEGGFTKAVVQFEGFRV